MRKFSVTLLKIFIKKEQEYQKEMKEYLSTLDEEEREIVISKRLKLENPTKKPGLKKLFPDKPKKLAVGIFFAFTKKNDKRIDKATKKAMVEKHGKDWLEKKISSFGPRGKVAKVKVLNWLGYVTYLICYL